jgi:hypothetical protein
MHQHHQTFHITSHCSSPTHVYSLYGYCFSGVQVKFQPTQTRARASYDFKKKKKLGTNTAALSVPDPTKLHQSITRRPASTAPLLIVPQWHWTTSEPNTHESSHPVSPANITIACHLHSNMSCHQNRRPNCCLHTIAITSSSLSSRATTLLCYSGQASPDDSFCSVFLMKSEIFEDAATPLSMQLK